MMRNFAVFGLVAGRYFWLARGAAMTLATSENWSLSIVASLSWPPQLPPFPKAYNSGWNEPSGSLVRTLSLLTLEDTAVTPSMASAARALVGASNPNVTARTHGIMGCVFIAGLKGGTRARRSRKRCARWCCGGCGARRTHADAGTGPGGPGSMALTNGPERPHMAEMPPRRTRMQFKLSPLPPLR